MSFSKRYDRRRRFLAALLFAALMPFVMVKATHFHHVSSHEDTPTPANGSCQSTVADDCAICHFTLPVFEEAVTLRYVPFLPFTQHETPTVQDKRVCLRTIAATSHSPPAEA